MEPRRLLEELDLSLHLGRQRRLEFSGQSPWKQVLLSCSVVSDSLQINGLQPTMLLCPWDSPAKNTGVGCPFPFHGISRPGDQTHVSCIAGGFFTTEPSEKPPTPTPKQESCTEFAPWRSKDQIFPGGFIRALVSAEEERTVQA